MADCMDSHTLELLEFPKVKDLLAAQAACSLGKELARSLEPAQDLDQIQREIELVTEMTEALASQMPPPFGGLHDVRMLVRRAAIGSMLNADELLQVKDTLACTGNMYRYRMRLAETWRGLSDLLARVEDLGLVAKLIEGAMDARGNVLDLASPELAAARQELRELEERAQSLLRRLLRDPETRKILRYPNATMVGDHHVLPVAANYRHRLPGVVHRTSSTGETVYIEPAGIAHLAAERAVLKATEEREVQRVLRRLTGEVGRVARPLQTAIETLARLDLVFAKARLSLVWQMAAPKLNAEGLVWLRQARHPLLEHIFRQEAHDQPPRSVVPIDVRLGQAYNLLVITGPNTGGKTVALKTVGLLSLMAQSGMHLPAEPGSTLPVWHQVLADIGDEQSLEQSLSTFSAHMSRVAEILRSADRQSLVLLDELGAGTDPTEGAALGRAILDQLDQIGCRAMVTTHLGDLKTYAWANPRAENAAVEFDPESLQPTYRLQIGQFGMSNALKIARRFRLPRELLRRARHYLRRRQRRGPDLARLQEVRAAAEEARAQALLAQHEAERQRQELEQQKQALEREARAAQELRLARGRLQPGDPVRVARLEGPGQIVRVDFRRNLAVVKAGLGQWEIPLEEVFPAAWDGSRINERR